MKIAITAESTIDLTNELLQKFDIKTVPFSIILGEKIRSDGEITPNEIIEYVNKNKVLPKTSAINEAQYNAFFKTVLKEYDAVIHFALSSELSSTYNNAVNVAKQYNNIYIVDSLSLSTGIALQAIFARKLANKNFSPEQIVEICESRRKNVQASFELKRIDYLYKGGRCNALMYLGANILKIRPQILLKDGKMISGKKYRGNYDYVVKNYVNDILEEFNNPDLEEVFITYTTSEQEVIDEVYEKLKEVGFRNINITKAGATITSHCGENCLGVLYINDGGYKI